MVKAQDTEKQILDAARRVFIRKGLSGARMQEIADEAGINKALLHYYFRSKEKLFDVILKETFAKIFPSLPDLMMNQQLTFRESLTKFVDGYITAIQHNPFLPAFVINEINQNPDKIAQVFETIGFDGTKIKQVQEVLPQRLGLSKEKTREVIVTVISLCVFPFVGKPILKTLLFDNDDKAFETFLEERKARVVEIAMSMIQS
ncbi:MAG: TetR/AcrR family transcriptional regulator [Tenuifilaceae bacterium]|jgi:AcrR family transcriptional regulator|nr:TetR/AcrR family transcriptional regulator [Tenuifilaceae bacterium]